jgi:hypothetical protein
MQQAMTTAQLPTQFQTPLIRPEVIDRAGKVFQAYKHKSSIYTGMQRKEAPDKNKHGQYVTFRRVSDLSDPNAWIHTGITAHNFLDRTIQKFDWGRVASDVKLNFTSTL